MMCEEMERLSKMLVSFQSLGVRLEVGNKEKKEDTEAALKE